MLSKGQRIFVSRALSSPLTNQCCSLTEPRASGGTSSGTKKWAAALISPSPSKPVPETTQKRPIFIHAVKMLLPWWCWAGRRKYSAQVTWEPDPRVSCRSKSKTRRCEWSTAAFQMFDQTCEHATIESPLFDPSGLLCGLFVLPCCT